LDPHLDHSCSQRYGLPVAPGSVRKPEDGVVSETFVDLVFRGVGDSRQTNAKVSDCDKMCKENSDYVAGL
jgi:hypothetical protein